MSGAWQPAAGGDRGFLANYGASWVQDNFSIRGPAEGIERLNRWNAAMRPPPVEGYTPFSGDQLQGYEDSFHLFRGSQSPEETEFIKERIRLMRERAQKLDSEGAFVSRFLAAVTDPVNLLLPGAGTGRTVLGTAARWAGAGAAMQVPYTLMDQQQLPGALQGNPVVEVGFAALLGGALGGLAGSVSRRTLDTSARRHAAVNDAYDGLTTPGLPEAPRWNDVLRERRGPGAPESANENVAAPRLEVLDDAGTWWRGPGTEVMDAMGRFAEERIAFWRESADQNRWPTLRLIDARDRGVGFEDLIERRLAERGLVTDSAGRYVNRGEIEPRLANENEPEGFRAQDDLSPLNEARPRPAGVEEIREPPVPSGMVRVYHSGTVGDGQFGRWVSTNRTYASDYRRNMPLHFLDLPANDPRVNNEDIPEQGIRQGFTFNFELSPEEAARLQRIARPDDAPSVADGAAPASPPSPRGAAEPPAGEGAPLIPAQTSAGGDGFDIPPPPRQGPPANDNGGERAVDVNRIGSMPQILAKVTPYWGLKANPFGGPLRRAISALADEIVQTPISGRTGNEVGASTLAESAEAGSRQWMARYADASDATFRLYAQYRGWSDAWGGQFTGRLRTMAEAVPGVRQGPEMPFSEFREEVFKALYAGKHDVPEVAEAARVWTERVFAPMAEAGARAGVLLLASHRKEAKGAIIREMDGRRARLREADDLRYDFAGFTTPEQKQAKRQEVGRLLAAERQAARDTTRARERVQAEPDEPGLQRTLDEAEARLETARAGIAAFNADLDARAGATPHGAAFVEEYRAMREAQSAAQSRLELLDKLPKRGSYLPHVHNHRAWREGGNDAVERVGRHFADEQPETTWASPMVRAEVTVAHILGESIPDTVSRVLRRTLMDSGMSFDQAAVRAGEMVGGLRAILDQVGPARLGTELRSVLGMRGQPFDRTGFLAPLRGLLDELNVRTNDEERLVRELLNIGMARNTDEMAQEAAGGRFDAELGDFARPGHARQRKLDVPTEVIADYLDRDILSVALQYARGMGAAIEMGNKFGDPSMLGRLERMQLDTVREVAAGRVTLDQRDGTIKAARDLRDKVLGSFMIPEDPSAWSVRSVEFLQRYAILTQMGGALLANVMDTGRMIMAFGFRRTFGATMDELARNPIWREAADEGRKAGAAVEIATLQVAKAAADVRDVGADRLWAERAVSQAVPAMFMLNLVAPWTQMAQRVASGIFQSDMVELSRKVAQGSASPEDVRRLAMLGIDAREASRIAEAWQDAGGQSHGKLLLANTDAWADTDLRNRFRARLVTAVDQAVTKPGAADLPNFMSAPVARMLLLYRGFAMSFAQRAILAGVQQRDAMVLSGAMASIAIAYLTLPSSPMPQSVVNWDKIHGRDTKRAREDHIVDTGTLFAAVERAGVLSLFGDVNRMVEMASGNAYGLRPLLGINPPPYARDPNWGQRVGEVAGPAVSPWMTAMWAFTSEEAKGSQQAGVIRRLLPFNNLIWWEGAFRALGAEGAAAIGNPDTGPVERMPAPGFAGGR